MKEHPKRRKRQGVEVKQVLIHLTPDTHNLLKVQAAKRGESVSSLIEMAVLSVRWHQLGGAA